ncbi:MAG TPA: hypothetical protein VFO52_12680 [Longimicrobiales bacterium]|nr:hypothetical protein [Longimicrobiales bacterium]
MKSKMLALTVLLLSCGGSERVVLQPTPAPSAAPAQTSTGTVPLLVDSITPTEIAARVAQFAPALLDFDDRTLAPWEKQVLVKLVDASRILHDIYTIQVSPQNPEWRAQLASQTGDGQEAALQYFDLMVGPWDRLAHDEPFLEVGRKPAGAGYYPADMTKQEFEAFLAANPAQKDALTGYFTVITRDAANRNKLVPVPYSTFYRTQLEQAAALLRAAAGLSQNASLSDFLRKRADAFLSNDYYASDVAWMDISNSRVEPTIGPYEVYEDNLFGYKAAFESFITVADPDASAELDNLKNQLKELEARLPLADQYKNVNRGFESPIRVVDVVYSAGDARRGVQTIAFNLPNDERVIEAKGSKKVMLRNVMRAKFDKILTPISQTVLTSDLSAQVEFQPWFINVLMHELAHGLGPQGVNKTLKERHSALEEAKADVTGLHNLGVLAERGIYKPEFVRKAYIAHLGDLFRATRFGTSEAHGKANLIQFNYYLDKGALRYDVTTGRFSADLDAIVRFNRELASEILAIQATGDYERAGRFIASYGTNVRPEMRTAIARLNAVPVDVKPEHAVFDKMKTW